MIFIDRGGNAAFDDLEEISQGLAASAEDLAVALLGSPPRKGGSQWRYGRKGSLAVTVRGRWRGRWRDHEAGAGGDGIGLIQRERGCSFPDALAWARSYLGMPERESRQGDTGQAEAARAERERIASERKAVQAAEAEAEAAERTARAQAFWAAGRPIAGTVAETYLNRARAIPTPRQGWPEALRYHHGERALMAAATNDAGELVAVQLVRLTAEGTKIPKDGPRLVKQTYGVGGAVRLPGRGEQLMLAEGPETGLSVWTATGSETWIALGGMGKLTLPADRRAIVCADDDPPDQPAAKALRKVVGEWRASGRSVAVVLPRAQPRGDKDDFNDLMREAGAEAVAARIEAAIEQRAMPRGLPLGEAREALRKGVEAFIEAGRGYVAPLPGEAGEAPAVHAIRVGVGIGKSFTARDHVARELAAMRARGDQRTVAILVPTHKLGAEQAASFEALPEARAAGLKAAVWRGRQAPDPAKPGKTMCQDLDAVLEAQAIGLPVQTSCCSRTEKPRSADAAPIVHRCPLFDMCGYQAQRKRRPDLWIGAHELLYAGKPEPFGELAFLIVDEAAWQDGLEGVAGAPVTLSLDALSADVWLPNDVDRQALRDANGIVRAALARQPDGPVKRDAMLAAGLAPIVADAGRALTWLLKVDPKMRPGMTAAERRSAAREAAGNKLVMRTAKLFAGLHALVADGGPESSGWVHLAKEQTDHGPVRVVHLRGRRNVAKGWQVPTLILDAILDAELLRPYWPQVVVTAEVEAETPHMRVRQLVGRDFPKSALLPDGWRENDPAELRRREGNSRDLRAVALREARAFGGAQVLLVAQKGVEDAWQAPAAGPLPSYISMAHHNDVAGRDEWRSVRAEIVVGRTLPKAADAGRMAEALTGAAVAVASNRYLRDEGAITLRSGETIPTTAMRHPDPMAERIRWQICEGELIQIIGRCRGVSRTAETPVDVLILTDTALPIAVDQVVAWEALKPSPDDLMLSAGGVALADAEDAAEAYPELWQSGQAARYAFRQGRSRCVHFPLREIPKGGMNGPLSLVYQRAGPGRRPTTAVADPAVIADLGAWIAAKFGEVVERLPDGQATMAGVASETVAEAAGKAQAGVGAAAAASPAAEPAEALVPAEVAGARLFHLGDDPPLPGEAIGSLPTPASVPPASAVALLTELTIRLEAVKPPRLHGDGMDLVRIDWWHERRAAARARWPVPLAAADAVGAARGAAG